MKKACYIFTALFVCSILIFLNGCGTESNANNPGNQQDIVTSFVIPSFANNDGYLYFNHVNNLITYYDFKQKKSFPVCDKPNCTHNSSECRAYFPEGNVDNLVIYRQKIYFWLSEGSDSSLYVEDASGSNRKKLLTLDKLAPRTRVIYEGGKVYYDSDMQTIDQNGTPGKNYEDKQSLGCTDLSTGKNVVIGSERVSKYGGLSLLGYYHGKLYYSYTHLKDSISEKDFNPEDNTEVFANSITDYYTYDTSTGEEMSFLKNKDIDFDCIKGEFIAYEQNTNDTNRLYLLNLDTMNIKLIYEGKKIKAMQRLSADIFDNKVFYFVPSGGAFSKRYYYDIKTGKTSELISGLPETEPFGIIFETDDKFIVHIGHYDENGKNTGENLTAWVLKKDCYAGMKNYAAIPDAF